MVDIGIRGRWFLRRDEGSAKRGVALSSSVVRPSVGYTFMYRGCAACCTTCCPTNVQKIELVELVSWSIVVRMQAYYVPDRQTTVCDKLFTFHRHCRLSAKKQPPTSIPAEIWECSLKTISRGCWGYRSEDIRLITRVISPPASKPILYGHDTWTYSLQMDGRRSCQKNCTIAHTLKDSTCLRAKQ